MKRITLGFLFLLLVSNAYSQAVPSFGANKLVNSFSGYNFFVGDDASDFITTPKAFGSGIADFSGPINILNFWLVKPSNFPIGISASLGFKFTKFRFEENYSFGTDTNALLIDNDPEHYYDNTFFSRQGSKLVTGKIYLPLMIYLPVHNWFNPRKDDFGIFGGVFYEGYLFSYHKLFYNDNNQLVKNKTPNSSLRQYFTKNGFGVRAGLKISNFFVFGQYLITPIFNNLLPYDLHEAKFGLNYYFDASDIIDEFDFDKYDKDKEDDFGTDAM